MSCTPPSGFESYVADDSTSSCGTSASGGEQWFFTVKNNTSGPVCVYYSDSTSSEPGNYLSVAAGACTQVNHSWDNVKYTVYNAKNVALKDGTLSGKDGEGCCRSDSESGCKQAPCGSMGNIDVTATGWGKYGKYLVYGGIGLGVLLILVLAIVLWRRSKSGSNQQMLEMLELLN